MKKLLTLVLVASAAIMISLTGCNKEGPAGAAGRDGTDGTDGTNGVDANETCKLCHAADVVDKVTVEFELAKHNWGIVAEEEAGNTGCSPCHCQEAFKYVVENNIPSTFTLNTTTGKYVNDYATVSSAAYGAIGCYTCHSELHTTYGTADLALTTTAPVAMTMWGGAKTIDLPADGGSSNLCVKCHQPRPMTVYNLSSSTTSSYNGRVLPYDSLRLDPNKMFFDTVGGVLTYPLARVSYRTHNHYGTVGAVYAGEGAVEFAGTFAYNNSPHTTIASCSDCHMATITGIAGGHSFNMRNARESALTSSTTWNFNGCNVSGCHDASPISTSSTKWTGTRAAVKTLLDQLATKINALGQGQDILHKATIDEGNLWAGITTGNYDGYLDIYSSSTNPSGYWRDPWGSGSTNAGKPMFPPMSYKYMGAIINFQFCLREYSLGIHNTQYVTALLSNTIAMLP